MLTYQGNPCIDEDTYTKSLAIKFYNAGLPYRFVVDTGRNGIAGIRSRWGAWCNVKGAGIGAKPQANPSPFVDAFVWVKPPGESDGVSGPPGTLDWTTTVSLPHSLERMLFLTLLKLVHGLKTHL